MGLNRELNQAGAIPLDAVFDCRGDADGEAFLTDVA